MFYINVLLGIVRAINWTVVTRDSTISLPIALSPWFCRSVIMFNDLCTITSRMKQKRSAFLFLPYILMSLHFNVQVTPHRTRVDPKEMPHYAPHFSQAL